jgi:hypothetical protein
MLKGAELLLSRKAALDAQNAQLAQDMARLAGLSDADEEEGDEEDEEEEYGAAEPAREFVDRWTGGEESGVAGVSERAPLPRGPRRNIGLMAGGEAPPEPQIEEVQPAKKDRHKDGRARMRQVLRAQRQSAAAAQAGAAPAPRIDENRLTKRILEAVMPRVENLMVGTLASGGQGVKLERHEAKQLLDQLTLLDAIRGDVKSLKVKVGMKIDRAKVESDLRLRITRDELLRLLLSLFPDNEQLKSMAAPPPAADRSQLPPLVRADGGGHADTQGPAHVAKGKGVLGRAPVPLRPTRNSNMISLNQRFLRGVDGHYYLRDMGQSGQPAQGPSIFGAEHADVAAAMDFQRFQAAEVETATSGTQNLMEVREQTPMLIE